MTSQYWIHKAHDTHYPFVSWANPYTKTEPTRKTMLKSNTHRGNAGPGARFRKLVLAATSALALANGVHAGQGPQPSICSRACWGARAPQCSISQMSGLTRAIIHHTGSGSEYSTSYETSKAKCRGNQSYVMDSLGYCDADYHFYVDGGGHIFEGRAGSMSSLPRGSHDGCNANSFGYAVLGNFETQSFPTAARNALEAVIAWRMPSSWTANAGASSYCSVSIGSMEGHYRVKATACPGDNIISQISNMRTGVMNRKNGIGGKMAPSMFYDLGNGAMNIYRWASSGSSFSTITQTGIASGYTLSSVGNHMASADVNADGRTDNVVAYQYGDGTMRLHVFINGSAYQGPTGWFQSGTFAMSNVGGRMVGGDFNNDGKGDVAMIYDNGGGFAVYRFLSTGSDFNYDSVTVATSGYDLAQVGEHVAAADVNGDGKDDIVMAYQYGDGTMRLHVLLNGNSYQGPTGWYQSGAFAMTNVAGRIAGGDFDGNGKGDIAMLYDNGGGMTVYRFLSSGSSFSASTTVVATSGYDLDQVGTRFCAGDINGDGKADTVVAYQYADNTFRYHTFLNGNSYQGATGWYQSGAFNLSSVGGRMTMGTWQ